MINSVVRQELLNRVARCRHVHDLVAVGNGEEVVFDWELASIDGARFELFCEPHHTDEHIKEARRKIRADHDVVGMRVTRIPNND